MYGFCHCGCGGQVKRANRMERPQGRIMGEPNSFINFHHDRRPWSHTHIPISVIAPDLVALLKYRSARQIAWSVGRSEAWISMVRSGQIATVHTGVAQRVAELARGSRHIADDVARKEKGRIKQAERRARQKAGLAPDSRRAWRESREGGEYVCTICGSPRVTPHALYLHAFNAHGDRSQGKSAWGKAVVA
jgi:hypothetical protein